MVGEEPGRPHAAALFGCLYTSPSPGGIWATVSEVALTEVADAFSPRYERQRDGLVTIDLRGLERLFGTPRAIAEAMRRDAASRGLHVRVAVATTCTAALVLAIGRPGLSVVAAGGEAAALAMLPIRLLEQLDPPGKTAAKSSGRASGRASIGASAGLAVGSSVGSAGGTSATAIVAMLTRWGVRTLGELAALPPADLAARTGRAGLVWQAMARGEDTRPLVPTRPNERFESSMELEWPIEGIEPLSFVLTRLLEPLSTRLERGDRGAAVLHVVLNLITKTTHTSRLDLPAPMREVRALRTLALLDLEAHPPDAAIDRVTITIDPTPGRILQHTLFARPHPTPEQLSTLLARLGALMGQNRVGAPVSVDAHRPGAFAMKPFAIEHGDHAQRSTRRRQAGAGLSTPSPEPPAPSSELRASHPESPAEGPRSGVSGPQSPASSPSLLSPSLLSPSLLSPSLVSALRRYRQPVPARVAVGADERPIRMHTDRAGWGGGTVTACAGPWRTSGAWWEDAAGMAGTAGGAGTAGDASTAGRMGESGTADESRRARETGGWDRDEWDVALTDGAMYRIFLDRAQNAWFVDGVVD